MFFLKVIDDHVGDAVEAQDARLDDLLDHVEQPGCGLATRRIAAAPGEVGVDDGPLVRLPAAQGDAIDIRGEERAGLIDLFAHFHISQVHVGAGDEVDADLALVAPGTGADAIDIIERAQRLLQGQGDQPLDFLGRGVVVLDAGGDAGGGNTRKRLHGQAL